MDANSNYFPTEEPDAKEVIELIKAAGRKAVAVPADIRTLDACERVVADAVSGLGGLDILVNNAANQQSKKDNSGITDEQLVRTFQSNIFAPFRISKAAIPHLKPASFIINTGSVSSYEPEVELLDYASTKGPVLDFQKGWQRCARLYGGTRPDLDSAAGRQQSVARRYGEVRSEHAARSGRTTGRVGRLIRNVGFRRIQLYDRYGSWSSRRQGKPLER